MTLGGAMANALAFTGSSYLFSSMSKDRIDKERKRHDNAIEQLQKAQIEWQQKRQKRTDFINKRLIEERKAEKKFSELDDAMREYSIVFEKDLPPIPKPKLSDFYTPTDDQHYRELTFIAVSMVCVGGLLYYVDRRRTDGRR